MHHGFDTAFTRAMRAYAAGKHVAARPLDATPHARCEASKWRGDLRVLPLHDDACPRCHPHSYALVGGRHSSERAA